MNALLLLGLVVAVCVRCIATVWPDQATRDAADLTDRHP